MPFTPYEEEEIGNHIPTTEKNCRVFMDVFDTFVGSEEDKLKYLLELLKTMKKDINDAKKLIESHLP